MAKRIAYGSAGVPRHFDRTDDDVACCGQREAESFKADVELCACGGSRVAPAGDLMEDGGRMRLC